MAVRWLTRSDARKALGEMPERSFARLCARGLPHRTRGKTEQYPWPEIYHWDREQAQRQARDSARPASLEDARARKVRAEADIAELELARKRGELLTLNEWRKSFSDACGRLRGHLNVLAPRLGAAVVGCKSIVQGQKLVQEAINEILKGLYEAEDVPVADERGVVS